MAEVLLSWDGTRYLSGCAIKQRGADCIGFVEAVVRELYGDIPKITLPSPVGISHKSEKFLDFYRQAIKLWPVQHTETVDVGDLILDRPKNGHAHLYITGSRPYELWHCQYESVVAMTGFSSLGENLELFKLKEKARWIS